MENKDKDGPDVISIAGNRGEGGGQILRLAIAFSPLVGVNITVNNIRGGRDQKGLRPQHLKGVQLARDMCNGKLTGDRIGSEKITFFPSQIQSRDYVADMKTAGSIGLLAQVALPIALFGSGITQLTLKGGTNVAFAPTIDYTQYVFLPTLKKFGAECNINHIKRGFYPKGGGEVSLSIPAVRHLNAVNFLEFGDLIKIWGISYVAGVVPINVAREMFIEATGILKNGVGSNVPIDIRVVKESPETAFGNGSGIILIAETSTGCILGSSHIGGPKIASTKVAENAAAQLIKFIQKKVCVDDYLQDQIICLMALANGKSAVKCGNITKHTRTAIYVLRTMTKASFTISEQSDGSTLLECNGIGLLNRSYSAKQCRLPELTS